ncbi:amidohydrolase [Pseudomonadales bacterium]|jgi:predicted TIM-barrel fold metal-dependent hydrolase|nr:amidohydrolase family protein [Gammaproteobacteria bacterium]MDA7755499.1 amidohydrolase [Pseudomonadales bacterium]MDA7772726.1 amidohydrolase [Pseudomonadales bacterium]MDB2449485.1 amidohydrolase [Pseudomonadales bacterium]MDC0892209.1 amidohydrolase family protein [Pseudomonadales bacterium]|tara:strand:+ start:2300 stop:3475 length:1176 start_codon:yes stop_codon:yes gene_type:complete
MTYAPPERAIYDADSHIMELPDFLKAYADPDIRDDIPEVSYSASLVSNEEVDVIMSQGGVHSAEHVQSMIDLGDKLIESSKEIQALGAFNKQDRTTAMDMLGFRKQLVFATHSVAFPFHPSTKKPLNLRYGATRAHNRHMIDFCQSDDRLMGVGIVPLDDAELAYAELEFAIESGLEAIWVPHRAPHGKSPGHVDLEKFWALLAESGTPFLIHVGGAPLQALKEWSNNGRAAVKDWMGGGENVRTKDAAVMHQPPETFISMMVLDGVFDRNPKLRGAAVELGAGWVPEMLKRLDWVSKIYGRVDESVRFERTPSQQLTEQMGFTPFPHEDVAMLIEQSNPDLYLFSSDYPHVEGGRNPLGKFDGWLEAESDEVKDLFFTENFLRLFPDARS